MIETFIGPLNIVKNATELFPCLYGLGETTCRYNPESAQAYFSLGDAVAALGLMAAVIQLSNIEWKMVRRIRGLFLSRLWIFFGVLALMAVFIASFVTQTSNFIPPYSYPIFWEHLGLLFFVLSPLSYWLVANSRRKLFNKKTAENFYHVMMVTAVDGRPERLEAAINIIRDNLSELLVAVDSVGRYYHEDSVPEESKYAVYAQELLNVMLSDRVVSKYIVCNRMDFLVALFSLLKEKKIPYQVLSMGVSSLVNELLNNKDSYLFRQLDYHGTTLYAPIYKIVFGDSFFISEYHVLKQWNSGATGDTELDEQRIKVYIKALENSLSQDPFIDDSVSDEISFNLFELASFTQSAIWLTKSSSKDWGKLIGPIEHFFGHTFIESYKEAYKNGKVSVYEKEVRLDGKYRSSLTASYAMALVEFLSDLSSGDDKSMERMRAMDATNELVGITDRGNELDNLRKGFFDYMWEKVKENVEMGYFPPVFRIFLEIIYWDKGTNLPEWYLAERKKLIKYMQRELKPRIKKAKSKDSLMANYKDRKEDVLLPDNIIFDKGKDDFYIVWDNGSREKLK